MDKNRQEWERMSLELLLLSMLNSKILCDHEYNRLMDKKRWDKLFRIDNIIMVLRSGCEDRMAQKMGTWSTHTFYPIDRTALEEKLEELRAWVREEAIRKAKAMSENGEYI